ncbi:MAG: dTDP-4-amino-4,6-dideoxygalactose transaminase [Clostridiales bacterium]|nr:dTDP-4-amino-4,6-dideoxygalactose transaminase [Clostridiales bacterium]
MIDFNIPPFVGTEIKYVEQAIKENRKLCGDGPFTKKCRKWMEANFPVNYALLTTSCTHALEMAALLCDISEGDEVIMPSYTFVSTADAFVQRGARIVFVDIRPDTMNLDETLIEDAVTDRTRAIVPVHYAGVACEMDTICHIAEKYSLRVVEDAAQAFGAYYNGKTLGTIGDYGALSFHETKNLSMGEGGALLFDDPASLEKAEIIREKGTNRSKFFRGQIDKYTWVDYGSSYLPSDMNAAYLWGELLEADRIQASRLRAWELYYQGFSELEKRGLVSRPVIPDYASNNAHMFYLKTSDTDTRTRLLSFLKEKGILAVFHYVPLHTAPAGRKFGRFHGEDRYTTSESGRLLRLPMYYGLKREDQEYIISCVCEFFGCSL